MFQTNDLPGAADLPTPTPHAVCRPVWDAEALTEDTYSTDDGTGELAVRFALALAPAVYADMGRLAWRSRVQPSDFARELWAAARAAAEGGG
jgi:hypothetical protein